MLPLFFAESASHNAICYELFVLADGLGALVTVIRRHDDEPWVLPCLRLIQATYGAFTSRRTTHDGDLLVGQLNTVTTAMAKHPASADVQVAGCAIVSRHAMFMYNFHASLDASLVPGIVNPLLEALRLHPDNVAVQGAAIEALAQVLILSILASTAWSSHLTNLTPRSCAASGPPAASSSSRSPGRSSTPCAPPTTLSPTPTASPWSWTRCAGTSRARSSGTWPAGSSPCSAGDPASRPQ